jgi:glucosamine-6-phosphate deaminase
MHNNLYDHINIKPENIYIPNGEISPQKSVKEFNDRFGKVEQVDLAILGIGVNGHIGFNEPGTSFDSKFRLIKLEESTIEANARNFSANQKAVPKKAMSMGISEIMSAKKIVLLASGRLKAEAIYKMIKGPITDKCPASFLQKHKNIIVIVDQSAAINI